MGDISPCFSTVANISSLSNRLLRSRSIHRGRGREIGRRAGGDERGSTTGHTDTHVHARMSINKGLKILATLEKQGEMPPTVTVLNVYNLYEVAAAAASTASLEIEIENHLRCKAALEAKLRRLKAIQASGSVSMLLLHEVKQLSDFTNPILSKRLGNISS